MEKTDKCIHNYSNTYYGLREQYIYNAKEAQKRDNSVRQGKLSEVSEVSAKSLRQEIIPVGERGILAQSNNTWKIIYEEIYEKQ